MSLYYLAKHLYIKYVDDNTNKEPKANIPEKELVKFEKQQKQDFPGLEHNSQQPSASLTNVEIENESYQEAQVAKFDQLKLLRVFKSEVHRLRVKCEDLREEPRRARENFILLALALTCVYVMINFALFLVAEQQFKISNSEEGYGRLTSHPQEKFKILGQANFLLILGGLLTLFVVPATHLSGEYLYKARNFQFYQPLEGGWKYVALQAFGWFFYALSLFGILLFVIVFNEKPKHGGLIIFSGVLGNVAQTLIMNSLLMFRKENNDEEDSEKIDREEINGREQRSSSVASSGSESRVKGLEIDLWLDSSLSWNDGTKNMELYFDNDTTTFAFFLILNFCLVANAIGLSFTSELASAGDEVYRIVAACLSLLCIIVAAFITHGLGGDLYHNTSGWRFFQPFVGGTVFCLLQTITWSVFAISVASQFVFILFSIYISTRVFFVSGFLKLGGFAALVGQLISILSLRYFKAEGYKRTDVLLEIAQKYYCEYASELSAYLIDVKFRMEKMGIFNEIVALIVIGSLSNLQYVLFIILSLVFYTSMPLSCAAGIKSMCYDEPPLELFSALFHYSMSIVAFTFAYSMMKTFKVEGSLKMLLLIAFTMVPLLFTLVQHLDSQAFPLLFVACGAFALYNFWTYTSIPELTGSREWEFMLNFMPLWDMCERYFGATVRKDKLLMEYEEKYGPLGRDARDRSGQFFACFHPHGILPLTMLWMPLSRMWKQEFSSLRLTSHTASIIHYVPIMRDICQWIGVRDVSRESVDRSINDGQSPVLVVGGQSEMFLSKSYEHEIMLHRRHRGFVRMSIKHGIPLLPLYSFGEHRVMDNVYLPRMQAWFKSFMGFPVPFFPYGRWFLPVPRRTPLTVCVGKPIYPLRQNPNPSRKEIEELHSRYFEALEDLFERNKTACGFPNHRIKWVND